MVIGEWIQFIQLMAPGINSILRLKIIDYLVLFNQLTWLDHECLDQ